jgi:hypothetical protein
MAWLAAHRAFRGALLKYSATKKFAELSVQLFTLHDQGLYASDHRSNRIGAAPVLQAPNESERRSRLRIVLSVGLK